MDGMTLEEGYGGAGPSWFIPERIDELAPRIDRRAR
jgi:hypothetical protein